MIRTIVIGRGGIFGNPFDGTSAYRMWLWDMLDQDVEAGQLYEQATGNIIPASYEQLIIQLADMDLYCPTCRARSCEPGVCHGAVLHETVKRLKANRGRPMKCPECSALVREPELVDVPGIGITKAEPDVCECCGWHSGPKWVKS